jgi:hypothetical protein
MAGGALQAALIRGRLAPVRIHAGENSRQYYGHQVRDMRHWALRGGVSIKGSEVRAEEGTVRVN